VEGAQKDFYNYSVVSNNIAGKISCSGSHCRWIFGVPLCRIWRKIPTLTLTSAKNKLKIKKNRIINFLVVLSELFNSKNHKCSNAFYNLCRAKYHSDGTLNVRTCCREIIIEMGILYWWIQAFTKHHDIYI
jgi:hypothetical protein